LSLLSLETDLPTSGLKRFLVMSEDMALPLTKPAPSFLLLPPEVRDCIYDAALSWPVISDLAKTVPLEPDATVRGHWEQPLCTVPRPRYGPMSTPSFLCSIARSHRRHLKCFTGSLSYWIQPLHTYRNSASQWACRKLSAKPHCRTSGLWS
jgi:hypothetical protein